MTQYNCTKITSLLRQLETEILYQRWILRQQIAGFCAHELTCFGLAGFVSLFVCFFVLFFVFVCFILHYKTDVLEHSGPQELRFFLVSGGDILKYVQLLGRECLNPRIVEYFVT